MASETPEAPATLDGSGGRPTAAFSLSIRVRMPRRPARLGELIAAIEETGAQVEGIELLDADHEAQTRALTVSCIDTLHAALVADTVAELDDVALQQVVDRTFALHEHGKIAVGATIPLATRDDLSMAYTPGVGRVCTAIADAPELAWSHTIKGNTVAVVSDGTAVLGLGDIGPEAAMPVMEGKALLFKEFAGVDAFPLCVDTTDVDEIVAFVKAAAPTFGGVNLEDIAAPRCFEIERRLRAELDIPVFHDDQHGTAIVTLAGLINALRVVEKRIEDVKIVITGAGAAGAACADIVMAEGARHVVLADSRGAVYAGRPNMDPERAALAARTNPRLEQGSADELLRGADVYLGLSAPGAVSPDAIRTMAPGAIVFAMANPTPEVMPEAIAGDVAVIATGRSDYPNQINNVLAFPGVFRGALDVRAGQIDEEMKLAAARAIAGAVPEHQLGPGCIVPSALDRSVAPAVARAVAIAAQRSGLARQAPEPPAAAVTVAPA
jgi:malate dehydrogenase (oxaloacetate-decarboxylating)